MSSLLETHADDEQKNDNNNNKYDTDGIVRSSLSGEEQNFIHLSLLVSKWMPEVLRRVFYKLWNDLHSPTDHLDKKKIKGKRNFVQLNNTTDTGWPDEFKTCCRELPKDINAYWKNNNISFSPSTDPTANTTKREFNAKQYFQNDWKVTIVNDPPTGSNVGLTNGTIVLKVTYVDKTRIEVKQVNGRNVNTRNKKLKISGKIRAPRILQPRGKLNPEFLSDNNTIYIKDPSKWDVTLLSAILNQKRPLMSLIDGFQPFDGKSSFDVLRAFKEIRNELQHAGDGRISQAKYETLVEITPDKENKNFTVGKMNQKGPFGIFLKYWQTNKIVTKQDQKYLRTKFLAITGKLTFTVDDLKDAAKKRKEIIGKMKTEHQENVNKLEKIIKDNSEATKKMKAELQELHSNESTTQELDKVKRDKEIAEKKIEEANNEIGSLRKKISELEISENNADKSLESIIKRYNETTQKKLDKIIPDITAIKQMLQKQMSAKDTPTNTNRNYRNEQKGVDIDDAIESKENSIDNQISTIIANMKIMEQTLNTKNDKKYPNMLLTLQKAMMDFEGFQQSGYRDFQFNDNVLQHIKSLASELNNGNLGRNASMAKRADFQTSSTGIIYLCIPNIERDKYDNVNVQFLLEAKHIQQFTGATIYQGNYKTFLETIDLEENRSIKWIHFIGHGGENLYGRNLGLVLADDKGDVERIDDGRLINALRVRKTQLELVTFNACSTNELVDAITKVNLKKGGVKDSWGWSTKCHGHAASIIGKWFYYHYFVKGLPVKESLDCAKAHVDAVTQAKYHSSKDNVVIKDTVYKFGDPENNEQDNCLYAGVTYYRKRNWNKIPNIQYEEVQRMLKDKILGKGSFGNVHAGWYGNGKDAAIKILSKETLKSKEKTKNAKITFLKEAEVLKDLNHRNIIKLFAYSVHKDEDRCALIFERVKDDLHQVLFDKNRSMAIELDFQQSLNILIDIARGLAFMHGKTIPGEENENEMPVLHRDLKSANIGLMRNTNGKIVAKILDYGIAKTNLKSYDSDKLLTNTIKGAQYGTPGYIDPDSVVSGKYSIKSDIYSFGVVVLEILTKQAAITNDGNVLVTEIGDDLYDRKNIMKTFSKYVYKPFQMEKCSFNVFECGIHCIQQRRKERPDSMKDVFDVLCEIHHSSSGLRSEKSNEKHDLNQLFRASGAFISEASKDVINSTAKTLNGGISSDNFKAIYKKARSISNASVEGVQYAMEFADRSLIGVDIDQMKVHDINNDNNKNNVKQMLKHKEQGRADVLTDLHIKWEKKIGKKEAVILAGENITDNDIMIIGNILESNVTLKKLDLRRNNITDVGVQTIMDVLKSNNTLTLLNLRNNGKISPSMRSTIRFNKKLQYTVYV